MSTDVHSWSLLDDFPRKAVQSFARLPPTTSSFPNKAKDPLFLYLYERRRAPSPKTISQSDPITNQLRHASFQQKASKDTPGRTSVRRSATRAHANDRPSVAAAFAVARSASQLFPSPVEISWGAGPRHRIQARSTSTRHQRGGVKRHPRAKLRKPKTQSFTSQ